MKINLNIKFYCFNIPQIFIKNSIKHNVIINKSANHI